MLTSADQVDEFSWVFSHEMVERMSTGTGSLIETSPHSGDQIADGEPEGSNYYAWRLNGNGPVVTSYWSFLDQAFIIPDGHLQRMLLLPIWSGGSFTGEFVSLQQGSLYEMSAPDTQNLIDANVQSYTASTVTGAIFELTSGGQVREYSGSGTAWNSITGVATVASALVTTYDGSLYMLASNNGQPSQVWQYSGSGNNWTAITGLNTTVRGLVAAGIDWYDLEVTGLYMLAYNPDSYYAVWVYSGSGMNWTRITGSNTYVSKIAAAAGNLYMMGGNNGIADQVWQYNFGATWELLTGSNTTIVNMAVAGDVLVAEAANSGPGVTQIWQYGLTPDAWIPLSGTNTNSLSMVVQDATTLYMLATNGAAQNQVWQYSGNPNIWAALTGANTYPTSLTVSANNQLYMFASLNGDPGQNWLYEGTPGLWSMQ